MSTHKDVKVTLDKETFKKLKIVSIQEEITVQAVVSNIVEKYLNKKGRHTKEEDEMSS